MEFEDVVWIIALCVFVSLFSFAFGAKVQKGIDLKNMNEAITKERMLCEREINLNNAKHSYDIFKEKLKCSPDVAIEEIFDKYEASMRNMQKSYRAISKQESNCWLVTARYDGDNISVLKSCTSRSGFDDK